MKIYLVRHGETDWNNLGKIQGQIDNPLNSTGKMQAKECATFFNDVEVDHLVTSPLDRAMETMEHIKVQNDFDMKIHVRNDFIERNFGALEGIDGKHYYTIEDFSTVENYELDEDLIKRTVGACHSIVNEFPDSNTVVTCHSHTIRSVLIGLFPEKYNWDNSKLKNCAIIELEHQDGEFNLIDIH